MWTTHRVLSFPAVSVITKHISSIFFSLSFSCDDLFCFFFFFFPQPCDLVPPKVIIAGAGGAAHLPGMVASLTTLPVIGVPVKSSHLSGLDSLYSIVQMPRGVPVATVAIGNALNAGLLAARMLAIADESLANKLVEVRSKTTTFRGSFPFKA
jgi:hypothetical protein